jgi:hypothetical protein
VCVCFCCLFLFVVFVFLFFCVCFVFVPNDGICAGGDGNSVTEMGPQYLLN